MQEEDCFTRWGTLTHNDIGGAGCFPIAKLGIMAAKSVNKHKKIGINDPTDIS